MKKAIIIGAGTYGQVYALYLKNEYDIIGYIDDDNAIINKTIDGLKVLGNREFLFNNIEKDVSVFVPIGNNNIRVELLSILKEKGFKTPSYIHPDTNIHESVQIGYGVYILPNTSIMPYSIIKDYTMISMGVNIAHHDIIGNGCFFSQGTNVGASIHIEDKAYLGIASTIMTGVKRIGKNALIGAGAVVIKDVPEYAVMAGVPAKILKYKDTKHE